MRSLSKLSTATASYSGREKYTSIVTTTAVWTPGWLRRTGILRAHAAEAAFTYNTTYGWVRSVRDFQQYARLGLMLKYLGITTETSGHGDVELRHPAPKVIAGRGAQLNTTLPPEHKLPTIKVYNGADIPAATLLQSWVDDELLLATGGCPRPFHRLGKNALIAAHDIAVHLPSRLAMDPQSRAAVAEQCSNALADPGKPDINGDTRVGLLAGAIDRFIAPPNLGAAKFGDTPEQLIERNGTKTVLHHLSNFEAGGTRMPREHAAELGLLSLQHVEFLADHMARLPQLT